MYVCVYHLISICMHVYIAGPYDLDNPPVLSELCSLLEKQFGQQVWFDFQKFEEDGSLGPVKKVQDETSFEVSSCVSFRMQCYTSATPFFFCNAALISLSSRICSTTSRSTLRAISRCMRVP